MATLAVCLGADSERGSTMKAVEFVLTGDPERAKATAIQALESRKFRLAWSDEWTGVAERGNKIANAIFGALAQYFKVGVRVMSGDAGQAIVRLDRLSRGMMGGAIGAARTTKNFNALRVELEAAFGAANVLVATREE